MMDQLEHYELRIQEHKGIAFAGDKMHQHIGAGEGDVFLFENPAAFVAVGDDHLDILTGFLVEIVGLTTAIAEYGSAAFVGHTDGGKEWL